MVREQFIAQNRPAGKPAPDMSVTLSGLKLDNPVVPASGTFGYGNEDKESSRRVEFHFSLKDSEMIDQMNRLLQQTEGD